MKTLCRISTVVLSCLVLAVPAAADELSLAKSSILPGESISYAIKVEGHPIIRETAIAKLMITAGPECLIESANQVFLSERNFAEPTSETSSDGPFTALGTYQVCEYYRVNEVGGTNVTPKIIKTFKVVSAVTKTQEEKEEEAAATKKREEEATRPAPVVAPAPAPPAVAPVAPVNPPVVTPVTKPVSRLAKALKQCKKLKKHSKRVACEKRAKKRYGSKPKRH